MKVPALAVVFTLIACSNADRESTGDTGATSAGGTGSSGIGGSSNAAICTQGCSCEGCAGPCTPGELRMCEPASSRYQQCSCDGKRWMSCQIQDMFQCDAGCQLYYTTVYCCYGADSGYPPCIE